MPDCPSLPVASVRFLEADIVEVDASSFPELVLCAFPDAHGRIWKIREKLPVLCGEDSRGSPGKGMIAGMVVADYGDLVRFDTEKPWGMASVEGVSRFTVYKANLRPSGEGAV